MKLMRAEDTGKKDESQVNRKTGHVMSVQKRQTLKRMKAVHVCLYATFN